MPLDTVGWVDEPLSDPASLLTVKLAEYLGSLRPAHPISILDVSPHPETGLALARWVRRLPRKVRLMTYDWRGSKASAFFAAAPEVLVEKGSLPGVHFSGGSFDFVVGVDVLAGTVAALRGRAIADLCRTSLRLVLLAEMTPSPSQAEIADLLVGVPGKALYAPGDAASLITIQPLLS